MALLKEFKAFIMRGNVVDLAVGVVIGGAFGKIVSSIVGDIVMPLVGLIISNINFKDLKLVLSQKPDGTPLVTLTYGNFIQNVVEFLIIGAVIFLVVKAISKLQNQKPPAPVPVVDSKEIVLLGEIRDLLKSKQ